MTMAAVGETLTINEVRCGRYAHSVSVLSESSATARVWLFCASTR